jgi:hypothetical protein
MCSRPSHDLLLMISHDLECNVFSSFSFSVVKSQKKFVRT